MKEPAEALKRLANPSWWGHNNFTTMSHRGHRLSDDISTVLAYIDALKAERDKIKTVMREAQDSSISNAADWLRENERAEAAEAQMAKLREALGGDNPTHWLAPMEATKEMLAAAKGKILDYSIYEAMRDAYLKEEK